MKIACPVCNGKGSLPNPAYVALRNITDRNVTNWPNIQCLNCYGSGWVEIPDEDSTTTI